MNVVVLVAFSVTLRFSILVVLVIPLAILRYNILVSLVILLCPLCYNILVVLVMLLSALLTVGFVSAWTPLVFVKFSQWLLILAFSAYLSSHNKKSPIQIEIKESWRTLNLNRAKIGLMLITTATVVMQ
jgi:hypothetical protein